MSHTKEPWNFHRLATYEEPGWVLRWADQGGQHMRRVDYKGSFTEEDARRIVACVNACADLSTDALERFGLGSAFGTRLFEVEQQRDELLASLDAIVNECDGTEKPYSTDSYLPQKFIEKAREAIAKAKGGAA